MKKKYLIIPLFVLFILLGFFLFILASFYHSRPKTSGNITVEGLKDKVNVVTDEWGVPHIFAQNEKDLFFVCGYMHAQERMWQMDLIRRVGSGRLSEILGKTTAERDRALRNLGLKEAALRDFEKLSPPVKNLLDSYCLGINYWMDSRKWNWPPEFILLRYRPEPWRIVDSLIVKEVMALLLCMDYPSEIVRANLVNKLGAQKALEILEKEVKKIPQEIDRYSLSGWLKVFLNQGSNNWVVAGSRTESGKPLLANDPHLEISIPPIWYEIHLQCPSFNVIGVSLPGIPLVVIGHNESIAWGLTNSAADVQDLYIERLNSSNEMYLDVDGWKPLQKKEEVIKIRGKKKAERMEILWTAHGPIISSFIIQNPKPLSLRWTIYDGGKTADAFYLIDKAQNWEEFTEAVRLFDTPSQNFVYADKKGNIGYYLSGKIPLRSEEAALFPFPGWLEEGHWHGFLEEVKKPHIFNPEEGLIVTANNKIIPEGYPFYVSADWDVPIRAERIRDLLLQRQKHSVDSFKRIQNDIYSKQGELLLAALKEVKGGGKEFEKAFQLLKGWDLQMSSGKEPALIEVFLNFFTIETFKDELGKDFEGFDSLFRRKDSGLFRILSNPSSSWFDKMNTSDVETRSDIVKISLEKAYEWLSQSYGALENWDWMRMHALHFQHILGRVPLFTFLNRGPFPVSGSPFTVKASFSTGYKTTHGASYRQILDLSNWNNCVCVITSGQSGHFLSRFYDDQIPLWLEGRYHPMLFYKDDIEANASGVLVFEPKNPTPNS